MISILIDIFLPTLVNEVKLENKLYRNQRCNIHRHFNIHTFHYYSVYLRKPHWRSMGSRTYPRWHPDVYNRLKCFIYFCPVYIAIFHIFALTCSDMCVHIYNGLSQSVHHNILTSYPVAIHGFVSHMSKYSVATQSIWYIPHHLTLVNQLKPTV